MNGSERRRLPLCERKWGSLRPEAITNDEIAEVLGRVASLLEAQGANPYRVNAYRRAARVVEGSGRSMADLAGAKEGETLEDLPEIGMSIGCSIREFVHTARLGLLERLEGQISPEGLFTTVPGIGEKLAGRIHSGLHIRSLEELELAAHDGRLRKVKGIGDRRLRAIESALETLLSRTGRRRARRQRWMERMRMEGGGAESPSIDALLHVDEEYRAKAGRGRLRTIAPRRFNPEGKSWLPILHTEREGWYFTALFSNTARAHELGKTRDWVVLYYEKDGQEGQHTVVTETLGLLKGQRVVRGREAECAAFYASSAPAPDTPSRTRHEPPQPAPTR